MPPLDDINIGLKTETGFGPNFVNRVNGYLKMHDIPGKLVSFETELFKRTGACQQTLQLNGKQHHDKR